MGEDSRDFDIRAYLGTALEFKWLILATTVVVGAGVILWTLTLPRVYEASTTLEYDPSPQQPLGQDLQDVADPLGGFWSSREYYATQNRILTSRTIAERVVRRLELHQDESFYDPDDRSDTAPEIEDLASLLLNRVTLAQMKDTRLVTLTVRDRKPERARAIADAFVDEYLEKTMEDRMGSTVNALEWLGTQLDDLRRELEQSELALHDFKQEHNILSVSMEDRQNLVAGEIEELNKALTMARHRRIEASAHVARIRNALNQDVTERGGTIFDERSSIGALRETLREKLAERNRAGVRYGASHPTIVGLDSEIAELRGQLDAETRLILRSSEDDLREIRTIESGIRDALEQANAAGLELNLREIEYRRLSRKQENNSKLYQLVLQRTTETDLTRMLNTAYARVVDRAQEPEYPVAPNRTANAIGGILVGLLLGIGLAFLIRFLDRRIRSPEAVEALGLTVLGVLPRVGSAEAAQRKKKKRRRSPATTADTDLIVHDAPMSAAAECIRTIRTNLTFMTVDGEKRAFVVTGSLPREGKTTVATNLAASIAQSGKSVLLIDTDLRKPRIHKALGIPWAEGVSSYVVGEVQLEDIIQETRVPRLSAITSGPVPPNPAELLHSARFAQLIEEATERFDTVIFDSPPLGAVTDAAVIAPQVAGVILVTRATETTRDALKSSRRALRDVGARVLGAVVNSLDLSADGYYGGYYYYYSRYGGYAAEGDSDEQPEAAE